MNKLRLANRLRYAAIPFALIALWSWLQPTSFPSWVLGSSLFLTFGLLAPSIILKATDYNQ